MTNLPVTLSTRYLVNPLPCHSIIITLIMTINEIQDEIVEEF